MSHQAIANRPHDDRGNEGGSWARVIPKSPPMSRCSRAPPCWSGGWCTI